MVVDTMSTSEPPTKKRRTNNTQKPNHRGPKLAPLPKDAKVSKRPLMRPPIPSPYASADKQKVVYVGSKTPFMSAVKRAEKLLHLSDKRLVQSATKSAQTDAKRNRRGRGNRGGELDEIVAVAETVERNKAAAREVVVIKGSGKVIPKVMQLGLWLQEREETYNVKIKTSTARSIDDVTYAKPKDRGAEEDLEMADRDKGEEQAAGDENEEETAEETRIRKVSVLEIYVSLR